MTDNNPAENDERVERPSAEPAAPAGPTEEVVTRGRVPETPFYVLGGLMTTIWTIVGLIALGLLLLWWLA